MQWKPSASVLLHHLQTLYHLTVDLLSITTPSVHFKNQTVWHSLQQIKSNQIKHYIYESLISYSSTIRPSIHKAKLSWGDIWNNQITDPVTSDSLVERSNRLGQRRWRRESSMSWVWLVEWLSLWWWLTENLNANTATILHILHLSFICVIWRCCTYAFWLTSTNADTGHRGQTGRQTKRRTDMWVVCMPSNCQHQ